MNVFSVKQLLRRSLAAFLAAIALWFIWASLPTVAAGNQTDRDRRDALATALLKLEVGDPLRAELPLALRILAGQIPLLEENLDAITAAEAPAPSEKPLPNAQPAPDRDDLREEPQTTSAPESIVERTLIPSANGGYTTGAGLYLYNRTDLTVDLAQIAGGELPFSLSAGGEEPQILIFHTHTTEAYTPDGTDIYTPSDENSRTLDEDYNMLRVGDEMAQVFGEMGLTVLHDRTIYDHPRYNGAYARSGEAVAAYLEQYPTIKLILDVHRDALVGSDGTIYKTVTTVDGTKAAQVMLVIGTDESGANHPDWTDNLTLAARLQKSLDTLYPTLARPMALRSSSYNQELSPGFLLVEVGSHGNTLQEALAGARYFARAVGAVCSHLEK